MCSQIDGHLMLFSQLENAFDEKKSFVQFLRGQQILLSETFILLLFSWLIKSYFVLSNEWWLWDASEFLNSTGCAKKILPCLAITSEHDKNLLGHPVWFIVASLVGKKKIFNLSSYQILFKIHFPGNYFCQNYFIFLISLGLKQFLFPLILSK